jgi:arginine exporter protein ArgO
MSENATPNVAHEHAPVNDDGVQKVRAWTGLLVVAVGDVAIVIAAIVGIAHVSNGSTHASSIVAILSSGFTAVGTMTTAYFGIRAASNTAQSSMKKPPG